MYVRTYVHAACMHSKNIFYLFFTKRKDSRKALLSFKITTCQQHILSETVTIKLHIVI